VEDRSQKREELPEKRRQLPDYVEESNSIGAPAGDATSGVPETPEEWAASQLLEDAPTFPLDAGDPSPLQPAAGSPDANGAKPRKTPGSDHQRSDPVVPSGPA